jgi:hypothetical protein
MIKYLIHLRDDGLISTGLYYMASRDPLEATYYSIKQLFKMEGV